MRNLISISFPAISISIRRSGTALTEGRELNQIVVRYRFGGLPGLAPCGESSVDHERVESFFSQ